MTLKEAAIRRYQQIVEGDICPPQPWLRIYHAGWDDNGEWTCCCCGRMYGKNLNGDKPYLLARIHAMNCPEQDKIREL